MKINSSLPLLTVLLVWFFWLPPVAWAQSLWREDTSRIMFADKRAVGIGDILTVLVKENSSTSKKNSTSTSKNAGMDASIASFLYPPSASGMLLRNGQMPAMKYSSKNDFTGGGTIDNSQALVTSIAVQVIDVLPNRALVIEGKRETAFDGEKQTATLHGIVRPEDILANNTIYSYNIAEAKVLIDSKGSLRDSQRKGWFTRIWDKVTPF